MIDKHLKPLAEQEAQPDLSTFSHSSFSDWKEEAVRGLKGASYEKRLLRTNPDDIQMPAIFTPEHSISREDALSQWARGRRTHDDWRIGQHYQIDSPELFGRQVNQDLSLGMNEIHLVFHSSAVGNQEIGKNADGDTGVRIRTLNHMSAALPREVLHVPLQMYCNSAGIAATAFWGAHCRKSGVSTENINGGIGYAPLSQLARTGRLPCDAGSVFDEAASLIRWTERHAPLMRVLLVDGTAYQAGGSSASVELAACLSEAAAYLRELTAREISIDVAANHVVFQVSVGGDFFEDIAKQRALRFLYNGLVTSMGGALSKDVQICARTSDFYASLDEPLMNTLRTLTSAMSGALGGAQSVHAAPFDELWKGNGALAKRIARNAQVILQKECHLGTVTDPCGGSYYLEYLTDAIAKKAWERVGQIDNLGGLIAALKMGEIQNWIDADYDKQQKRLNRRQKKMVGVNDFVAFDEIDIALRVTNSSRWTKTDESLSMETARDASSEFSLSDPDVMERAISSVIDGMTFEVLNNALKRGPTIEVTKVPRRRLAEQYEQLRQSVRELARHSERVTRVVLLRLGTMRESNARADFSRSFFHSAGFSVVEAAPCPDLETALIVASSLDAHITVICSTDEHYQEWAVPVTAAVHAKHPDGMIVLAGQPGELESALRAAGMSHFIFLWANHFELLTQMVEQIRTVTKSSSNGDAHE